MVDTLVNILNHFSPIQLEEMNDVKLMNRIDTKFIARREDLPQLLSDFIEKYYAQEVNGNRIGSYHTLYMDTADTAMYTAHQNGRKTRQKIRIREYVDSHLYFFEIKNKNNKGRTKKKRIELESMEVEKNETLETFMNKYSRYPYDSLSPQLENFFDRITLVNKDKTERLTIDCNLRFHNIQTDTESDLSQLIIIELKQDGNYRSEARSILLKHRIQPFRISKYCIGSALTNPSLKSNRFKLKIRAINKLINYTHE